MTIFYYDQEGGNDDHGGTSFSVLATGTDGTLDGAYTLGSASATFTPEMVGHVVAIHSSWFTYGVWARITAYVDSHNLTLEPYYDGEWPIDSDITFYVGGRWTKGEKAGDSGFYHKEADEARLKQTAPPYLLANSTWDNSLTYIDLDVAVAADIEQSTSNWTTANSATNSTLYSTLPKRLSAGAAAFKLPASPVVNTKYFYKALGAPLDLSAWSRVCFFMFGGSVSGSLQLKLCSDAAGATPLATLEIPAVPSTSHALSWRAVTIDYEGPLPSGINSIAIYSGASVPAAGTRFMLTNLIAVKAAGDPLEFTLSHLIGKEHNKFWEASTAYALGKYRKPSITQRNGFRYKVTTAGTSGTEEPVWPVEEGETVVDGTVTWTCDGPEDTWIPVLAITGGTRIYPDHGCHLIPPTDARIATFNETVPLYARLPLAVPPPNTNDLLGGSGLMYFYNGNGDDGYGSQWQYATVSGGWDSTDMSTVVEETWFDNVYYMGSILTPERHLLIENISGVRALYGLPGTSQGSVIKNCHLNGNFIGVRSDALNPAEGTLEGVVSCFNFNKAVGDNLTDMTSTTTLPAYHHMDMLRCCFDNNLGSNFGTYPSATLSSFPLCNFGGAVEVGGRHHKYVYARGCRPYNDGGVEKGFVLLPAIPERIVCKHFRAYTEGFAYPVTGQGNLIHTDYIGPYVFDDFVYADATTMQDEVDYVTYLNQYMLDQYVEKDIVFLNRMGVAGSSIAARRRYVVETASGSNRHTSSGKAYKLELLYFDQYPRKELCAVLGPFAFRVEAGTAVTFKIWCKVRDEMAWNGTVDPTARLVCRGGQLAGIESDVESLYTATSGTYQELSITVYPTESGVLEVEGNLWTNDVQNGGGAAWFDDMTMEVA